MFFALGLKMDSPKAGNREPDEDKEIGLPAPVCPVGQKRRFNR
jgi:hypothetical protein